MGPAGTSEMGSAVKAIGWFAVGLWGLASVGVFLASVVVVGSIAYLVKCLIIAINIL